MTFSRLASLVAERGLQVTRAPEHRLGSWGARLRCSKACGIFPDQGSNPCLLHWQADSLPLSHLGRPRKGLSLVFPTFIWPMNWYYFIIPNIIFIHINILFIMNILYKIKNYKILESTCVQGVQRWAWQDYPLGLGSPCRPTGWLA